MGGRCAEDNAEIYLNFKQMGALFSSSSPRIVNQSDTASAKVLPEIMIRHRPTCLSTDLEKGILDVEENLVQPDTKSP